MVSERRLVRRETSYSSGLNKRYEEVEERISQDLTGPNVLTRKKGK